ncbi:MAG: protein translocase subunit SecF [Actinobacteria bacterium]|nr:MAG: protein translocase subunit SecF [Actinomycetota bacterium]
MPAATGSVYRRLYRGETNIDFVGQRKKWYLASGILIAICVLAMVFRGFLFGIEFSGGDQYQIPVKPGTTLAQVRASVESTGVAVSSAQIAGTGSGQSYVIRTERLSDQQADLKQVAKVRAALSTSAHVAPNDVNEQEVSSSWGGEVTQQAIIALVVFLVVVSIFMAFRFRDAKAAGAALLALFHDLLLTAGVYSIVHFEVTPGTVVGLLTILGYSLYDTVVVFDKVDENTRGLLGSTRHTYAEAANLAVNQTLMRSINTSLIGLLPVAGLLFVGAGLLGVGTLQDLALVLFVGMITGAYSSLFLATPWLVDFKLFDPRYRNQAQRVLTKRTADAARAAAKPGARVAAATGSEDEAAADDDDLQPRVDELATSAAPRVGAKPAGGRPTGAKRTPAGRATGRPAGGKRRH